MKPSGISSTCSTRTKILSSTMLNQSDVLSTVGLSPKNDSDYSRHALGVPYFERRSPYPRYHRTTKTQRMRKRARKSPAKVDYDLAYPLQTHHAKRRAKRQLNPDPTAKHVEVLVAYDDSIKQFHSDVDIKSYILTLFSYVSFDARGTSRFASETLDLGVTTLFGCHDWQQHQNMAGEVSRARSDLYGESLSSARGFCEG